MTRLNFLDCGNNSITQNLNPSNSTGLEHRRARTLSPCPRRNGSTLLAQSALSPRQDVTVEHLHRRTLHLNLLLGSPQNSSCISSRTISVWRMMKIAVLRWDGTWIGHLRKSITVFTRMQSKMYWSRQMWHHSARVLPMPMKRMYWMLRYSVSRRRSGVKHIRIPREIFETKQVSSS